jgi:hypothetical protein
MELEGEAPVEGRWVDRVVGLNDVRADIAMMRTPNGHSRLELTKFHAVGGQSRAAKRAGEHAGHTPHHVRCRRHRRRRCPPAQPRCRTVGEIAQYEDIYRLSFLRGPEGISSDWLSSSAESMGDVPPAPAFRNDP